MIEKLSFFEFSAMSAVLPAVYGIINGRKLNTALFYILLLVSLSIVFEILTYTAMFVLGSNNFLINYFIIWQTLLPGLYFVSIEEASPKFRLMHKVILVLSMILVCYLLVIENDLFWISNDALTTSALAILIHCGVFMIDLINNRFDRDLSKYYNFFIVASLFLYYSSVYVIFLTYNVFQTELALKIWNVKLLTYIFLNFFIFYGFYLKVKSSNIT